MTDGAGETASEDLLPAGTPIDLDNCAREPIHIPGLIQPRGALLVLHEPDYLIVQASANLGDVVGVDVDAALGRPLDAVLGPAGAAVITRAASAFGDLRERNPHEVTVVVRGEPKDFDAILHREPSGLLVVEIELASGPRPYSFPNTFLAARGAVSELNRAASLAELYDVTARAVRELTGFDRVMVYRYDRDYNGEVVAEAKRDDLNSFLGQHYPASDIPSQARALYERNWIRLISDVDYAPAAIVPTDNPITGQPLDLTFSTLRSVSPIHVEYLQNMGVHASMSISLLREGRLWGLIACHHYAGPHLPPYGTRAAAEFLGSTLSLRLVDRADDDELRERIATQAVLAKITAAITDESTSIADALLGAPDVTDLVPADGVAVSAQNTYATRGDVPDEETVRRIVEHAESTAEDVLADDFLSGVLPDLPGAADTCSGALVMRLPDEQFVVWARAEQRRSIDWGGDPHNKAIAVREGDHVRLSPRKSFERWREVVRGRSTPWTDLQVDTVRQLRRTVVEAMYQRSRAELRLAETLQRSLLPQIPVLPGWELSAHYEPAAGGRIGGDWYDAFTLRDGQIAAILGDVAGHGIGAAGTMAQLRNAVRAHLFAGATPDRALSEVNDFSTSVLPGAYATAVVAVIDPVSGEVAAAVAGHPRPFVLPAYGVVAQADLPISPPLGVRGAHYRSGRFALGPGDGLVLFSDGLIERRGEDIDRGIARLGDLLGQLTTVDAHSIRDAAGAGGMADDATVLALRRGVLSTQ